MEAIGAASGEAVTNTYIDGNYKLEAVTDAYGSTYYNLYKANDSGTEQITESLNYQLRNVVAGWYNVLRLLAIIGMMSVLVYLGIRIILSTTGSQKAKYKELIKDWLVGMVLLFTMHYIMAFSNVFVQQLTIFLQSAKKAVQIEAVETDDNIKNQLKDAGIDDLKERLKQQDGVDYAFWTSDLMGQIRMLAGYNKNNSETYIGYSLMFVVLVMYLIMFCIIYLKRIIYMAFLTMIAPLVALTYPIDKVNDGSAQGFNYWFKEYIFNLLIQPMHLLLYTILVSSAVQLAATNYVYSLVALGFIIPAEKMVRKMFNFEKASTPGILAGPAGAAITMTGMRWLFGHGPKGRPDGLPGGKGSAGKDADSSGNDGFINTRNTSEAKNRLMNMEGGIATATATGQNEELDDQGQAMEDFLNNQDDDEDIGNVDLGSAGNIGNIGNSGNSGNSRISGNANLVQDRNSGSNSSNRRKRSILNGLSMAASSYQHQMGDKLKRRIENGQPIKNLARFGMGAASAATFGAIGLAAGVTTGDMQKALSNTAIGVAGGYKLGTGAYNRGENAFQAEGIGEKFRQGYYGEEEYKRLSDEKIKTQNEKIKKQKVQDEAFIKKIMSKMNKTRGEAEEKAQDLMEYMDYNVDNTDEMIKMEKFRESKEVVDNGVKRNLHKDEVVQLNKWSKELQIANMKGEEDRKKVAEQFARDEGVNINTAYKMVDMTRDYYKFTNS